MTTIDVVGGVYGERCAFPDWDEVYGSAGRAAAGLSGHVNEVRLHTVIPKPHQARALANFESFGIHVHTHDGDQLIGFDYLHCLADPAISPPPSAIKQQPAFEVNADVAVVFGMMECKPIVSAGLCIYDPQSPNDPKYFNQTGSKAKRLVVIANEGEIAKLSGKTGYEAAMDVLKSEQAEILIVKRGLDGAQIYDSTGCLGSVPAYKTKNVFTIGSGDIFVAAFALSYAIHEKGPLESADYASMAVAQYVETSAMPIQTFADASSTKRSPIELAGGQIYLAGPFRELGQRSTVNEARRLLSKLGMKVFSPVHDIGHGPAEKVVKHDLAAIENADAILAILNGSSPGTLFEVGYAVAKGKPVFCVGQNMRSNDMKLPMGAGCVVHNDFISTIHLVAWRK